MLAAQPARNWIPELIAGGISTGASLLSPMSFDESFWLAIVRMLASGRRLYDTAIDNKPPLVYVATWLIEVAPGPFVLIRAVVVGALVAWITRNLLLLTRPSPSSALSAVIGGLLAAVASQFHLTIELAALALLLAVARSRPAIGAAAAVVLAAGFDPRALLLAPAALSIRRDRQRVDKWNAEVIAGAIAVVAIALVVAQPSLRFGLIEMNLATRPPTPFSTQLLVSAAAILPLAALRACGHQWRLTPRMGHLWLLGSVALVGISRAPLDHYWVYLAPIAVLAFHPPYEKIGAVAYIALALSFSPLLWHGWEHRASAQVVDEHRRVASYISELPEADHYLYYGGMPWLALEVPERMLNRSPTARYLLVPTSRQSEFVGEFLRNLATAPVVVIEEGVPTSHPGFAAMIMRLPCVTDFQGLTVRVAQRACP